MFLDCPAYLNEEDPGHPTTAASSAPRAPCPARQSDSNPFRAAFAVAEMGGSLPHELTEATPGT